MRDTPLTAVIVDDERLARTELKRLLGSDHRIDVIGEAASATDAVRLVTTTRPDVVFLDIQLDRASGLDVAGTIAGITTVVFVTAYDQHAVAAFAVAAFDYLLKPVEPQRLTQTIDRLVQQKSTGSLSDYAANSAVENSADNPTATAIQESGWLYLRSGSARHFVELASVTHLTAEGDYTPFQRTDGPAIQTHSALSHWQKTLPGNFIRVHRAAIVNMKHVRKIDPWSNYSYQLTLTGNSHVVMSRRYAARVNALLGL